MPISLNEFQQRSVSNTHYPNQGKGSTLGMSMCLAEMSQKLGTMSGSFRVLVSQSDHQFTSLHARQEFLNKRKQDTSTALRELLQFAACYANEWGFNLEDVITGAAEQPSTVNKQPVAYLTTKE